MKVHEARALLAQNIRAAAKRKRVPVTALADFAGVSRSQLFDVLAKNKSPTVDWLTKIAAALDIEPGDLLKA